MSKPIRRKSRKPPVPALGHYVLSFQAPDGTMCDPPIPLDQRLTDAELRELVDGVHAKLRARHACEPPGITINQADELPGGIKLEAVPAHRPIDRAKPISDDAQSGAALPESIEDPRPVEGALADVKAEMERLATLNEKSMSLDEADRVLAANGIPPAPTREPIEAMAINTAPVPRQAPRAAGDDWGDAAATLIYKGLCLFTGGALLGSGTIIGGWATLKFVENWLAG